MKVKIDKKIKLEVEIRLQELILNIDSDILDARIETRKLALQKPVCDRCMFFMSQAIRQELLHEHFTKSLQIFGTQRINTIELFDKLVVDLKKQCSFCFTKLFELQKESFYKKNVFLLYETYSDQKYAESDENKMSTFEKKCLQFYCTTTVITILYIIIKHLTS